MIRSFLIVILLVSSQLLQASTNSHGTILILGDSISSAYGLTEKSGWVSLLDIKVTQEKKPYQVINASISGDTSINGLNRLEGLLDKYRPEIVVIELGGNDGLRGLSLKVMKLNFQKMIELCNKYNARVLLAGMKIPPNYGKRYTQAFYQVYSDVAKSNNIQLIPFILDGVGGVPELMQDDGIHPNEPAQAIILNTVWKKLKPML